MKRANRIAVWVTLGALLLPVLGVMALGPGDDNPLKSAKVGEWAEFVMKNEVMGQSMEMKMKQSVVAKDATSITLRTETTVMGKKTSTDTKIPFDQAYEPYKMGLPENVKVTVTPLGSGSETITVGGKAYACTWSKVKMVMTSPAPMDSTTKVWSCKDVPVAGMVKMETDSTMSAGGQTMNTKMTMELTGAGGR